MRGGLRWKVRDKFTHMFRHCPIGGYPIRFEQCVYVTFSINTRFINPDQAKKRPINCLSKCRPYVYWQRLEIELLLKARCNWQFEGRGNWMQANGTMQTVRPEPCSTHLTPQQYNFTVLHCDINSRVQAIIWTSDSPKYPSNHDELIQDMATFCMLAMTHIYDESISPYIVSSICKQY